MIYCNLFALKNTTDLNRWILRGIQLKAGRYATNVYYNLNRSNCVFLSHSKIGFQKINYFFMEK